MDSTLTPIATGAIELSSRAIDAKRTGLKALAPSLIKYARAHPGVEHITPVQTDLKRRSRSMIPLAGFGPRILFLAVARRPSPVARRCSGGRLWIASRPGPE